MEKVIDQHIRTRYLVARPLSCNQHAYQKGKSTESALVALIDKAERSLEDKQTALCAFLDIEGAFDNTPTATILKGLNAKGVDITTTRWVEYMLSNRCAKVTLNEHSHNFYTTRGCPQGGVLSPLLWTLAVDLLLVIMADLDYDTQGYADDLVVVVRGPCLNTISTRLQGALNTITRWCRENELSINADKTVIVPFTRKRKLVRLTELRLNGKTLNLSNEVKYLGVTIDQKLTWNSHLNNIIQKAKMALWICCRMAGAKWGLKPKMALWMYTAVVRPIITYASVVWCNKTKQKTTMSKLDSIQRMACLIITGAFHSAPGDALNALLDIAPLYLHVQKEAKSCLYRLCTQSNVKLQSQYMNKLKELTFEHKTLKMPVDGMSTEFNFAKQYQIDLPNRDMWLKNQESHKKGSHVWFTDGSKKGSDVGCGIYGLKPRFDMSVNLGKEATIFQAEVFAINKCAEVILERKLRNQNIYINSDSQAALLL
ncbi:unnamed protein product, partial [Brenthis ino]